SAGDRRGLFYGAVTLWQLCTASAPVHGSITLPALHIVDAPRFRWRGLMLDSARHFQSPAFIMRYIDWMALHKLNVLGWHLTADWGIYPYLFNVEASTFAFLEDVLAEVMGLFPGEYIHVGGDEAVKDQWKASARVQARMRELGVANEEALQGYFTHRMGEYLRAHDRRLVGWDEILEGGVPADATVMSWRGVQGAIAAAAAGHDAVLSPDPTLYLDSRQGRSPSEPPGRGTVETLADVYHFDPLPGPLAADGRHVLGLQ